MFSVVYSQLTHCIEEIVTKHLDNVSAFQVGGQHLTLLCTGYQRLHTPGLIYGDLEENSTLPVKDKEK